MVHLDPQKLYTFTPFGGTLFREPRVWTLPGLTPVVVGVAFGQARASAAAARGEEGEEKEEEQ